MSTKFKLFTIVCFLLIMVGCHQDDIDTVRQIELEISSSFEQCRPSFTSTTSDNCLKVNVVGKENSYYLGENTIAGFVYEPGYEYRILVKLTKLANPPADDSDTLYEFIKMISKKEVDK